MCPQGLGVGAGFQCLLETHRRIAPLGRFIKKVVHLEEEQVLSCQETKTVTHFDLG